MSSLFSVFADLLVSYKPLARSVNKPAFWTRATHMFSLVGVLPVLRCDQTPASLPARVTHVTHRHPIQWCCVVHDSCAAVEGV